MKYMELLAKKSNKKMVTSSRTNWCISLLILLLLMIEPNTYISYYYVSPLVSSIILMILGLFLYKKKKLNNVTGHFFAHKYSLFVCIVLVALVIISKFIHVDNSNYYFSLIMYIFVAFCFYIIIDFESFVDNYIKVLVFLSVYSLIATYSYLIFPSFFSKIFPTFNHFSDAYYEGHISFINTIFCNILVPDNGVQFRNFGIFREPGVYQFYLLIALLFELFIKKNSNFKIVGILFITLLSTFSTVGIVLAFITLLYFDIFSKNKDLKVYLYIVILGIIVFVIFNYFPELDSMLDSSLDKLNGGGSFDSRLGSLIGNANAWFEKPLFGWGYTEGVIGQGSLFLRQYTTDNTNTLFTNLALFGVFYGTIHFFGCLRFGFFCKRSVFSCIFISIIYIISMNTQRFIDTPIIFILIFYAFASQKYK